MNTNNNYKGEQDVQKLRQDGEDINLLQFLIVQVVDSSLL